MLVLTRKQGQRVVIGGNIEVVVLESHGDRVRLGFVAPNEVPIHREEIHHRISGSRSTLHHGPATYAKGA